LRHDGEILPDEKNLVKKRDTLAGFRAHPVRSRRPLADPASFYRNHVTMQDDPRLLVSHLVDMRPPKSPAQPPLA